MRTMILCLAFLGVALPLQSRAASADPATNGPPVVAATAPTTNAPVKPEAVATPPANLPAPAPPLIIEAPKEGPAVSTNGVAGAAAPSAPAATTSSGVPSLGAEAEEKIEYRAPPNTDLLTAIKGLAGMANLNLMFDPKLTNLPPVNIPPLKDVTARQALWAVLKNYDLIMVPDPETQIWRVTRKDPTAPEPLATKVFQLEYSSPSNMVALVEKLKTSFAAGAGAGTQSRVQVFADTRTSRLVILATTNELAAIGSLIRELDTQTRQVLISARILETSKNPQTIKGIDWSGTLQAQQVSAGNGLSQGSSTTLVPGAPVTTTTPSGRQITTTPGFSSQSTFGSTFGSTAGGAGAAAGASPTVNALGATLNTMRGFSPNIAFLNANGVNAVLSFLNQDSETEVISTPRAVTLDNEEARLEVTKAYPIFLITPGSASVAGGAQINYTNVGTILKVTPRISGTNAIALKVEPEVSNIDSKDQQTIQGQINQANVYASRKMTAHVLVPNGNTLVIGGLLSDNLSKSYTKVPILGDLPIIGLAFRRDSKSRIKQNLLIFVTPTIISENDFQLVPEASFLKSKPFEGSKADFSPWDSGKPVNWANPTDYKNPER